MRKYLLAFFVVFFLLSTSAWAQSGRAATINVPFSFTVNGNTLPAGNYYLQMSGMDRFISIQNTDTGHTAFVQYRHVALAPGKVQDNTRLIFTKEANKYVLHQVRIEGDFHTHDVIHMDIAEPTTKPGE